MKCKTSLGALIAGSLLFASACAAQSANVIPDDLPSAQENNFEQISKSLDNPCAEPDLAEYKTLYDLVKNNKVCHESWLLSETISFFLQAGYKNEDVLSVAKTEARNLGAPATFVLDNRPKKGPDTAPAQIVVFSDFQCPYCSRGAQTLEQIAENYPEDAQIIFKNMPLNMHPEALPAALCAIYANSKGKFWEVHDKFFNNQSDLSPAYIVNTLEKDLGGTIEDVYDPEKGHDYGVILSEDMSDASKANVHGTPTFFVNGVQLEGGLSYKRLAHRILAEKTAPAPASIQDRAKKRAAVLASCPYDNQDLKALYELLTQSGKENTIATASGVPCPCPNSSGSLHECVNEPGICESAPQILAVIMQRINEGVDQDKLLDELQALFLKARKQYND